MRVQRDGSLNRSLIRDHVSGLAPGTQVPLMGGGALEVGRWGCLADSALLSGQQSGMGFNDPPPGNQSTFRSTNFIVCSKYPNGMGLLQETNRRLREVSFLKSECQSLNISLETLPTAIGL